MPLSLLPPRLIHAILLVCLALGLGGGAQAAPAPSTTIAHPDLSIEGSALVLRLPDGQILRGTELQGAIVVLARGDGRATAFKLQHIGPAPNDPDVLRYDYQVRDASGRWVDACPANPRGETWGTALALPEGHPGRLGPITMACVADAVGHCVNWGYKPWVKGPKGEDLLPYHAACVRMVTADYGGDGTPHTRTGTSIDIWDDIGIQRPESLGDAEYALEAGWTPGGAVCVARTRWPDLESMEQLARDYPRLPSPAACTEAAAREGGALIYNRSRIKPRL